MQNTPSNSYEKFQRRKCGLLKVFPKEALVAEEPDSLLHLRITRNRPEH